MTSEFRTRVAHGRLWGGLGVVAAGAGAMAVAVELSTSHDGILLRLAELLVMLGAIAALITGAAFMFTAFVEVCATCGATLENYTTTLEADQYGHLVRALAGVSPMRLGTLAEAPRPPVVDAPGPLAAVEYTMCPHCRKSARLTPYTLRWNQRSARLEACDHGEAIEASGWRMAQFLRIARAPERRG
jgi:hypothetical protein